MGRLKGDAPIAPVVACVAYSLYKQEKRDWIVQRAAQLGRRPRPDEVDHYVSGWTDLRLESVIAQARSEIGDFAKIFLDASKEEINDQIYRGQFQSLHDIIKSSSERVDARYDDIKSHVSNRTAPTWGISIGQNLVANFVWTTIVVVLLVSLNLGFDFSNFGGRVKGFFSPPIDAPSNPQKPSH